MGLKVDLPILELDVDTKKLVSVPSRKAASTIRARTKRGADAAGKAIPEADDTQRRKGDPPIGEPLNRTGELLKAIRFGKVRAGGKSARVFPHGYHSYNGEPIAVALSVAQKRHGLRIVRLSEKEEEAVVLAARKELARQLKTGEKLGVKPKGRKKT